MKKRCYMLIPVEYDHRHADPDGLAVAIDKLLETATSTPGILDDYGNPKIGPTELPAHQFGDCDNPNAVLDEHGEVCVRLANGGMLISGWVDKDDPNGLVSGEYLKLLDPKGKEVLYYSSDEWTQDPHEGKVVIGAMINACAGQRRHGPKR